MANSSFESGDLQGQIKTLNDHIATQDITSNVTFKGFSNNNCNFKVYRTGNVVVISGYGSGSWSTYASVFEDLPTMATIAQRFYLYDDSRNPVLLFPITNNAKKIETYTSVTGLNGTIVYITSDP